MILQNTGSLLNVLCTATLMLGCAGGLPPRASGARPSAVDTGGSTSGDALDGALREVLARRAWNDLRLDADCRTPDGYRYSTLFASGVGIWNRERQLTLAREQVLSLLEELATEGFSRLREVYGEAQEKDAEVLLTCRVRLELNGIDKEVLQLSKGQQSAALKRIADRVLAVAAAAGRAGKGAPSLTAGLDGIARGELAPELLSLQVVRQPDASAGAGEGWTLNLSGLRASLERAAGGEEPRRLPLQPSAVAALAGQLAAARLEELPANLWAPDYTDLSVVVLNHRRVLQARRFAGLTSESLGERQQRFDRLWEVLDELRRKLQAG